MKVGYGKIVVVEYRVRLSSGQVVDSSHKAGGPLKFLYGQGGFPPPVESGIIGLMPGDIKTIIVPPIFGYGVYSQKKVRLISIERISEEIEIGRTIKAPDEFGLRRPAIVRSIWQGAVLADFNHPLAGKSLYFEIEIKDVFCADEQKNGKEHADGKGLETCGA
ncbi:MAG: FKBP-type peptidyl-prolyl cis-trans isomerase [Desulfobacteraceae bacterium]|nr:FKBP-type peptidyl-prolyl cis-trans isomerase [Desulfobacteraceae bacterium]